MASFRRPHPVASNGSKRWYWFYRKARHFNNEKYGPRQRLSLVSFNAEPIPEMTEKDFYEGSIVGIFNIDNKMIGKGITYYSSKDIAEIKGKKTSQIKSIMGKDCYDEIIHRDNMVIFLKD